MSLSDSEIEALVMAKALLENPGLAAKVSHLLGTPIEAGFAMLPGRWRGVVDTAARKSIEVALELALKTIHSGKADPPANWWHKLAVGTTGAAGGAFGLPALVVELPVSTSIILRSIADIARSEGERLDNPEIRLQCVQVLALGGKPTEDDAAETGYFAVRAAMAKAVSDAAAHLSEKGLAGKGAPAIVRFISIIASRFSITVSEKMAAQAVPIVGALGGAMINTLFIDHFQKMGKGHFIIRRLERIHGPEQVRAMYDRL